VLGSGAGACTVLHQDSFLRCWGKELFECIEGVIFTFYCVSTQTSLWLYLCQFRYILRSLSYTVPLSTNHPICYTLSCLSYLILSCHLVLLLTFPLPTSNMYLPDFVVYSGRHRSTRLSKSLWLPFSLQSLSLASTRWVDVTPSASAVEMQSSKKKWLPFLISTFQIARMVLVQRKQFYLHDFLSNPFWGDRARWGSLTFRKFDSELLCSLPVTYNLGTTTYLNQTKVQTRVSSWDSSPCVCCGHCYPACNPWIVFWLRNARLEATMPLLDLIWELVHASQNTKNVWWEVFGRDFSDDSQMTLILHPEFSAKSKNLPHKRLQSRM
jgi:hypothetical protein